MRRITICCTLVALLLSLSGKALAQQKHPSQMTPGELLNAISQRHAKSDFLPVIELCRYVGQVDPKGKDLSSAYSYLTAGIAAQLLAQQAEKSGDANKSLEYAKAASFFNRMGAELLMIQRGVNSRDYGKAYEYFWEVYKLPLTYIDYSKTS